MITIMVNVLIAIEKGLKCLSIIAIIKIYLCGTCHINRHTPKSYDYKNGLSCRENKILKRRFKNAFRDYKTKYKKTIIDPRYGLKSLGINQEKPNDILD